MCCSPRPLNCRATAVGRDALAGERRRQLVERLLERAGFLAERLDERRGSVRREVQALGPRAAEQPRRAAPSAGS